MPLHGRRFAGGSITTVAPPPLGDGGSGSSGTGGTSLSAGATGTGSLSFNAKAAVLYSIESNIPARVRFYGTAASRDADKNRKIGIKPKASVGLEAEYLFTVNNETITSTPNAVLENLDSPQSNLIYYNITNLTGGPSTVTLSMTLVPFK